MHSLMFNRYIHSAICGMPPMVVDKLLIIWISCMFKCKSWIWQLVNFIFFSSIIFIFHCLKVMFCCWPVFPVSVYIQICWTPKISKSIKVFVFFIKFYRVVCGFLGGGNIILQFNLVVFIRISKITTRHCWLWNNYIFAFNKYFLIFWGLIITYYFRSISPW